jgi:hypothetical protein
VRRPSSDDKARSRPAAAESLRSRALVAVLAAALAASLVPACGADAPPSPFSAGGGGASAASAGGGGASEGAGGDAGDPTLGGPCVDAQQCDDGVACTFDTCDMTVGRCRFTPDDSQCDNGVYCDGIELCKNAFGCVPGVPVTCDDMNACTIDTCDEATHACMHALRDADGDGDPDAHCGGHDCDDSDPTVSSLAPEICSNGKDDNCDGVTDETPCVAPAHDSCLDPLIVDHAGNYALSTVGDVFDYPTSCGVQQAAGASDAVAALVLPAGPPVDVELTVTTTIGHVSVAISGQCGEAATEIACGAPYVSVSNGGIARVRARGIGSASSATTLPIYVTTDTPGAITLDVALLDPAPKATNETCGTAATIDPGVPETVEIVDAAPDLATACAAPTGDLVYEFHLDAAQDVDVYATSIDGTGIPMISLRDAACSDLTDEITCSFATKAHVLRHQLPAGDYLVSVAASAPTYVDLDVEVSPPSAPPADDQCAGAPVIAPNATIDVDVAGHQDDVNTGCLAGAADAAYELDLARASDVLLVERISSGDTASIELTDATCSATSGLACGLGAYSPLRTARHDVPAGSYRVVAESVNAEPVQVTAFVRDAVPPTQVLFADTCAEALAIPSTGGFFQGNTANAHADYPAGCDQSGGAPNGGPEQMLKLVLASRQRVVLDMSGSAYSTLLDVRAGPACPGAEVPLGCTIGYGTTQAYLDLTLDAGTYYLQIDGYAGDEGAWFLDVRVVDP